jgi:spore germination protein GerM
MPRRLAVPLVAVLLVVGLLWILFVTLPRRGAAPPAGSAATATPAPAPASAAPERKITATLYYVADDATDLVAVQREVPFGDSVLEQARRIIESQLAVPEAPLLSAVPEGVRLRDLYLTDRGDAFVDLTPEVRDRHPGGSLEELFTVYTIVNALTVNLPAVQRVQILVDGQEIDTLAGHVDLRHPLEKSLTWVRAAAGKE